MGKGLRPAPPSRAPVPPPTSNPPPLPHPLLLLPLPLRPPPRISLPRAPRRDPWGGDDRRDAPPWAAVGEEGVEAEADDLYGHRAPMGGRDRRPPPGFSPLRLPGFDTGEVRPRLDLPSPDGRDPPSWDPPRRLLLHHRCADPPSSPPRLPLPLRRGGPKNRVPPHRRRRVVVEGGGPSVGDRRASEVRKGRGGLRAVLGGGKEKKEG